MKAIVSYIIEGESAKMVLMEFRIHEFPDDVARSLKAWANLEGKQLSQLVIELLREAVEKYGPRMEPRDKKK